MRAPRRFAPALASLLPLLVSAAPAAVRAQVPAAAAAESLPVASLNDNRTPAGTRRGRAVAVTLELGTARWRPAGDSLLEFVVSAFAEAGRAPQVPGPLLRVRVGDELHVTVRNPTGRELRIVGLADRGAAAAGRAGGAPGDTLVIPAGETRVVDVRLTTPGTFWYDAITRHPSDVRRPSPFPDKERRADMPLVGAFVVDSANAPADVASRDRIILVHSGFDMAVLERESRRRSRLPVTRLNLNGASWPNTERLEYAVGDTVRWHLVNTTFLPHPLHLHGFYFRVDGRGTFTSDTTYAPSARRMGVTELLDSYTTATITWVPERAGNWLFHCHLLQHMSPMRGAYAPGAQPGHAHGAAGESHDPRDHMAGMVMGIHVRGRAGRAAAARPTAEPAPRAQLALYAQSRDSALPGGLRGYGFVLAEGGVPARDSIRRPGAPIVVTRGVPVAITVHNRLDKPLAVHWHGIELESRYDGVGGWSGMPGSVTPAIAPADSFVVRFTPRRAGTFIYHTHDESDNELNAGLYGPLLVLEPGVRHDATREHVLVLASGADGREGPLRQGIARHTPVVNGDTAPRQLVLAPGRNRLRLIQIADGDVKELRLVDSAGTTLRWRVLAKDGWTRPAAQQGARPATLAMGVGETYDVELDASTLAARGPVSLEVVTRYYPGWRRTFIHTARVPVTVAGTVSAR